MNEAITVGGVDCEEESDLCAELNIKQVPTIMIYSETKSDAGKKYVGNLDWKAIANEIANKMDSFVENVNDQNFKQFIEKGELKAYKILIFNENNKNSDRSPEFQILMKKLSKQYLGKLKFGETTSSEKWLIEKFLIQYYPSIIIITNADEGIEGIDYYKYDGGM